MKWSEFDWHLRKTTSFSPANPVYFTLYNDRCRPLQVRGEANDMRGYTSSLQPNTCGNY
jgi:hypothetical protein